MKNLFLIANAIAIVAGPTTYKARPFSFKLPNFELMGFPISSHQVALLGGTNVEERSATPTLTLNGMPASPHQIAVLTPRPKPRLVEASADPSQPTVGLARTTSPRSAEQMCA